MASGNYSIDSRSEGGGENNSQNKYEESESHMIQKNINGVRGKKKRAHREHSRGRSNSGRRGGHRSQKSNVPVNENEFVIKHRKSYEGNRSVFGPPRVIGSYSVDCDRSFGYDKSQLKFLDGRFLPENKEIKVQLDLKVGICEDKPYRGSANDTFDNLLQWVIRNRNNLISEEKDSLSVDFLSSRSCLTNITKSLYIPSTAWSIQVILYNGTIYMKGEYKDSFLPDPFLLRSGIKLEQFIIGDNSTEGVDGNSEFRCVLSSNLDNIKLIHCAKLDCAAPELYTEDFNDLSCFISVKCCKEITDDKSNNYFNRSKTCQAWVENHLSGIPRMVFGFRSQDFIAHTLKNVDTKDLPEMANGTWEPNGCINFLNEFLKYVKQIAHQHPEIVIEFEKEKSGNITWQVSENQNMLPTWYTDNLFVEHQELDDNVSKNIYVEEQSDNETEQCCGSLLTRLWHALCTN